ncbi:MAG: YidC/Oxa1 family insertase periplasmic-domain containing protein [Kiritimatiellae bacterium]|nr:YidC/Oxa1 family insertase periplasmic-domain containing protein [Kiritimatiellia bacterium]
MNKTEKLIVALLVLLLCGAFYSSYSNNRKQAEWRAAHPASSRPAPAAAAPAAATAHAAPAAAARPEPEADSGRPEELFVFSNDVARVAFTSKGGAIRSVTLPGFDRTLDPADGPVELAFAGAPTLALAGIPGLGAGADFAVEEAAPGLVRMTAENADGLRLVRTVALTNGFHFAVRDVFSSKDGAPVAVPAFRVALGGIRSVAPTDKDADMGVDAALDGETPEMTLSSALRDGAPSIAGLFGTKGGGCSAATVSPAAPMTRREELAGSVGWVGVRERFFAQVLTPAVPGAGVAAAVSRKPTAPGAALALDSVGAELLVAPQERGDGTLVCDYSLYAGPRKMSELRKEGRDHLAVMRFGTWSFFCRYLLDLLNAIHALVPSYGLAIIILTVLVRLVLYPFTRKSTESMKKMQELQPKIKALQEKYKDDKRKLQQEQMKLYAEAKVNPLYSCLPMLIQLPVFIALFMVLRTSVELRHESFLWIRDLSEPENLFRDTLGFGLNLLPIGMAVTMTLQSRLTPSAGDPSQQKMMTVFMPIMMLVMCYPFASALGLYWVVSQAIAIAGLWRARRKGRPASFTQADGTEVIPPERETRQMRRERERRAEKSF